MQGAGESCGNDYCECNGVGNHALGAAFGYLVGLCWVQTDQDRVGK